MDNIESVKIKRDEIRKGSIFINDDLVIIDDLPSIEMPRISKTEIYIIVLVVEGRGSFYNNGNWHVAKPNDLVVFIPQDIIENVLLSANCRLCGIGVSQRYVQKVMPLANNAWDLLTFFSKKTICSLTSDEATVFCQYYDLLCSKMRISQVIQQKVIDALMLAWFYDVQEVLNRYVQTSYTPYTAGEQLFKKFIQMLQTDYPKDRRMAFYADKLSVTPKYLSAVCKKSSGQTASKLIDQYVLKDIEYLLKFSDKSIKEISMELDFPNISFFGKYVKNHFGASPKEVREQLRRESKQTK